MVAAVPEIADCEVRRELLRAGKSTGIRQLDRLRASSRYLPITSETMLLAAEFWAEMRRRGRPTAEDRALDGDVILAAQAAILAADGVPVVVATTNLRHLSQLVDARLWSEIE
jgi:predicted nucleic acid-binding protein